MRCRSFKLRLDTAPSEIDLRHHASIFAYTVMTPMPFMIPNTSEDELFADHPWVTGYLGVRF